MMQTGYYQFCTCQACMHARYDGAPCIGVAHPAACPPAVNVSTISKTEAAKPGDWLASLSSAERKGCAMSRGLFNYFPDALAMVARHSVRSNEKHNPGTEPHWDRNKSKDHEDCNLRHSAAIAVDPMAQDDGQYEIVCRAWRTLAALQIWIEEQHAKGVKL